MVNDFSVLLELALCKAPGILVKSFINTCILITEKLTVLSFFNYHSAEMSI